MKAITFFAAMLLATGCSGSASLETTADGQGGASSGAQSSGGGSLDGIACEYLVGTATLTDYNGEDNFAESSFSFEFASQDAAVTANEFELNYDHNLFRVNLITDDLSYIVDLGSISLDEVPATIELDDYPLSAWGVHDGIQANLGHSYYVRSVDGSGRSVAAFQVTGLAPGKKVTIDWMRSLHIDEMQAPIQCD